MREEGKEGGVWGEEVEVGCWRNNTRQPKTLFDRKTTCVHVHTNLIRCTPPRMPVSRSVTQFASLASLLSFVPAPRHHRPWTVPSARALVPSDNPQDNDLTRSAGSPTPPPRPESSRRTLDRGPWRFEEESGKHLPKEWSVSPNQYTHTTPPSAPSVNVHADNLALESTPLLLALLARARRSF